jgi:hypothetical protein
MKKMFNLISNHIAQTGKSEFESFNKGVFVFENFDFLLYNKK